MAERLDRRLTGAGLTRSQARKAVLSGRVTVDGLAARDPAAKVEQDADVRLDGQAFAAPGHTHLMMNKPAGCVTALTDARFQTVFDLIPERFLKKDLCAVGRLDRDVTGLLLFTTDGTLAHRLIAPRYTVEKVYEAKVDGILTEDAINRMAEGMDLGDFTARSARLEILAPDLGRLTVTEGKFHEVKRLFERVKCPVLALRRLSVGAVPLDPALAPGETRPLTGEEAARLYEITGLSPKESAP